MVKKLFEFVDNEPDHLKKLKNKGHDSVSDYNSSKGGPNFGGLNGSIEQSK